MFTDICMPVRVRHDIWGSRTILVKAVTRREITGVSIDSPDSYTATFWPFGPESATVTVAHLSSLDLIEA